MTYILAILGIAINFLSKFNARTKKNNFSLRFWLKDNWLELVQSVLWIVSIMILLECAEFDSERLAKSIQSFVPIPDGVIIPGKMLLSFLTGLSINHIVYWYNKRYIKKQKSNE